MFLTSYLMRCWAQDTWNKGATMRITIFAATGGIGKAALEQAVDAGHQVTAVVRNPKGLTRPVPAVGDTGRSGRISLLATGLTPARSVVLTSALQQRVRRQWATLYAARRWPAISNHSV